MSRRILLGCGVASTAVYLSMDVLGAVAWDGYSYIDQTVSELSAIGAPSRRIAAPLGMLYNILLIPFAAAVAASPGKHSVLRLAGTALAGIGLLGIVSAFFPIQMRGAGEWTINETVHVAMTAITVVLIVAAMAFGAAALGEGFLLYSFGSIAVMLLTGAIAGMNGSNLAANLPTPWMGVMERISIFTYLAWVAVLAIVLMRRTSQPRFADDMLAA